MAEDNDNLPEKPEDENSRGEDSESPSRYLHIGNLHLHVNDIDSLRRLSEQDPELARELVRQKESFDVREHASYRFAVTISAALIAILVAALSFVIVNVGAWATILLILFVVAVSALVRVVMTGEWSDTSWIGKVIIAIVKVFGGNKREDD